jgi:hypothetical protein
MLIRISILVRSLQKHKKGCQRGPFLLKENCIEIANMQAIQQQKIEELTLYTIAQEKQLAAQQKRLEELEALVGELLKQ